MIIETLNSLVLPAQPGMVRDPGLRAEQIPSGFDDVFDFNTLFYDAIYLEHRKAICLVCPKLFNIEQLFDRASFVANNRRLSPEIHHHRRMDEVWLPCPETPKTLQIMIGNQQFVVNPAAADLSPFEGLRCTYTLNRDNDLNWIRDWAEYNIRVHGLQGIVLFDNDSQRYTPDELSESLAPLCKRVRIKVLSAPFRYGLTAPIAGSSNLKFLQDGMANVARLRYLTRAASVLSADIDELVTPIPGSSVFEMAENSPDGYIEFAGNWRYPAPENKAFCRHADHVYRARWPFEGMPGGKINATKYCVCPDGPMKDYTWGTHKLHPGKSSVKRDLRASRREDVSYWHCRRISTDWKYQRSSLKSFRLKRDRYTETVMNSIWKFP